MRAAYIKYSGYQIASAYLIVLYGEGVLMGVGGEGWVHNAGEGVLCGEVTSAHHGSQRHDAAHFF